MGAFLEYDGGHNLQVKLVARAKVSQAPKGAIVELGKGISRKERKGK
jgi:hypothetical protein